MGDSWSRRQAANNRDTIFALSTPAGRSAVAVIRVSGPRAREALERLAGRSFSPRVAEYSVFRDPRAEGEVLDRGLGLFFPGPHSFTGEDCAEFQVHGSLAVVRAICAALATVGLRQARPGEFTRRAMDNGKIGLAAVENLANLIDAQTERQRKMAVRALDRGLRDQATKWQRILLDALASVEARLDFADEGDVDALEDQAVRRIVHPVLSELNDEIASSQRSRKVGEGFYVAICGPPNSGKSTLLNALARGDYAIVSPHAGTTRDIVEVSLELDGLLVTLCDTAGLRESADPVERIGIERARRAADRADLTIWLSDPDAPRPPDDDIGSSGVLHIGSKADVNPVPDIGAFQISAKTGTNLDRLVEDIVGRIQGAGDENSDGRLMADRLLSRATACRDHLVQAIAMESAAKPELVSAHLTAALADVDELGAPTADDAVMDAIFARFCIGK